MKNLFIVSLGFCVILVGSITSCKKKSKSIGNLKFSNDSVIFDTVFTTLGSTTKRFKFYNTGSKKLKIENIQLMGGSTSPFRINVDGAPGIQLTDVEIEGNDSLFVFVDVTLQVNNQSLPLIVEDSIRFTANGKTDHIILAVWGQDAYFHYNEAVSGIWPNDKPHVVYGYAGVDENQSLTIQQDTKIHFHKNSQFIVYRGSLEVQGTLDHEVHFLGDRLENFYKEVSGQWYGIRFVEAKPSTIDYAIIKNGTTGIQLDSTFNNGLTPTLTMKNTKIFNQSFYGIWSQAGAILKGENIVTSNCAQHAVFLFAGGSTDFANCTFANYGGGTRTTPSFRVQNYYIFQGQIIARDIPQCRVRNCIIYGGITDEFKLELNSTLASVNLEFANCLIKNTENYTGSSFSQIVWNTDPLFNATATNDFKLTSGSPARDVGGNFGVLTDILGLGRNGNTDLGAYEY